jgi:hypothetical protein
VAEVRAFDPDGIFAVLAAHGVEYVLIGWLAAALHGSSRVTTDAEFTPSRDLGNLERLSAALMELEARSERKTFRKAWPSIARRASCAGSRC